MQIRYAERRNKWITSEKFICRYAKKGIAEIVDIDEAFPDTTGILIAIEKLPVADAEILSTVKNLHDEKYR